MTNLYVSPKTIVVVGPSASALFQANKPREVRESLIGHAIAAGCTLYSGTEAPAQTAPVTGPTVDEVAEAIRAMVASGDKGLFTKSGDPRMDALRAKVPGVTDALRDAAWAIVKPETEV
ncbi:hypothetical protein VPH49_21955 [Pseudomonas luteola]|uniref:hypothetical protein n=1 Tax=Pseudomonas luteola TaxID=47886 RepID=UPI003A8C73BA